MKNIFQKIQELDKIFKKENQNMLNNILKKQPPVFSCLLAIIFYLLSSGLSLEILLAQEMKNPDPYIAPPLPTQYDKIARQCGFVQSADRTISLWQCIIPQHPKPSPEAEGIGNEIVWMIPINQQGQWGTAQIFDPLLNTITTNRLIGEILAVNQHGEWLVRPAAQPPAAVVDQAKLLIVRPPVPSAQQYRVQEIPYIFSKIRQVFDIQGNGWLIWDFIDRKIPANRSPARFPLFAVDRQMKIQPLASLMQNPLGVVISRNGVTFSWNEGPMKNGKSTTEYSCDVDGAKGARGTIDFPASNFRVALPIAEKNEKDSDEIFLIGTEEEKGRMSLVGWMIDVKNGCRARKWGRVTFPTHDKTPAYSWLEHAVVTDKDEVIIFYGQQWDVRYIDFVRQPDRKDLRADLWALKIVPDDSRDIVWDRQIISREDPISEAFSINLWDEAAWQKIGLKNWGLSLAYLPQIQKILVHPMIPNDVEKTKIFPTQPRVYQLGIE